MLMRKTFLVDKGDEVHVCGNTCTYNNNSTVYVKPNSIGM